MELKWIVRTIIGIAFFIFVIYLFKNKADKDPQITDSFNNNNVQFDEEMKKHAKNSLNSIFEKIFFQKEKKRKKCENKTENKCRSIIEKIFNRPFPSVRPDFLKSPRTGKNLELDCYNSDLNIALEYNGVQHYKYSPYFHKSKKDFYSQVHRDDWKRKKCKEHNIVLLEIPYWITETNLESHIRKELTDKGII